MLKHELKDKKIVGLKPTPPCRPFMEVMKCLWIIALTMLTMDCFPQLGLPAGSRQGAVLDLIWEFSIPTEDSTYIFVRYQSPKKDPKPLDHFFIEIDKGSYQLLGQPVAQMQKSTRSTIVNSTGKLKYRFVIRTNYYLANLDGTVSALGNKKSRVAAFGDQFSAVQKFQKPMN